MKKGIIRRYCLLYFMPVIITVIIICLFLRPEDCFIDKAYEYKYYYEGIVNRQRFFTRINRSEKIISGDFFFVENKPIADFHNFIINYNDTGNISCCYDNRYYKCKWEGIISEDSLRGKLIMSRKLLNLIPVRRKKWILNINKEQDIVIPRVTNRYRERIFNKSNSKIDIEFGSASGYYSSYPYESGDEFIVYLLGALKRVLNNLFTEFHFKKDLSLTFDLYTPLADTIIKRPLFVLLHNGAFFVGDKQDRSMVDMAEYFSGMGYAVATINYRLGWKPYPESIDITAYNALQDTRAGIRYLVNLADTFGIDTSQIFIGGMSAGGITALNVAFMDENERPSNTYKSDMGQKNLVNGNCIDCSTNSIKTNFSVKGVINMWGGIHDTGIININEKIPVLSFHGTADEILPIGYDKPFRNTWISKIMNGIFGAESIKERADLLNIPNKIIVLEDMKHSPHVTDNNFNQTYYLIRDTIEQFLYGILMPDLEIIGDINISKNDSLPKYSVRFNSNYKYYWKVENGRIISTDKNSIYVVWYKESKGKVISAVLSINDAIEIDTLHVSIEL